MRAFRFGCVTDALLCLARLVSRELLLHYRFAEPFSALQLCGRDVLVILSQRCGVLISDCQIALRSSGCVPFDRNKLVAVSYIYDYNACGSFKLRAVTEDPVGFVRRKKRPNLIINAPRWKLQRHTGKPTGDIRPCMMPPGGFNR